MTIQDWLGNDNQIGIDIWQKKYRYKGESFDEWLDRVSGGDPMIRRLIVEKKFLFAGRILTGRGVTGEENKVSLSNCYVVTPPEDNLESIYEAAKQMARTYSYGGGCGIDISKLAPKGARIRNAAKSTSGAVSFMELFAMSTALIGQHGRRGALMISIDGRHPDLLDFVDIKKDLDKLTKANTSIRIHDDFMQAVEKGEQYELSYTREATGQVIKRSIDAYDTFRRIAVNNWDNGEPGVLFWDRVTSWNLLSEDANYAYAGVNPCAEEPLPANGACLLGSINLAEFVVSGEDGPEFDMFDFRITVDAAVCALNRVLDEGLGSHPLPDQGQQAYKWRQIGLGLFGVADMCIKLGIPYGYCDSLSLCERIGKAMINQALQASAMLAKQYGPYPAYDANAVLASEFFTANADAETQRLVREYGLRNSQLLTIPPTGTTSTMLGVSNGIEPIFAVSYTRKTESVHDKDVYYKTFTPSVERYMREHGIEDEADLPDFITNSTAGNLDYRCRINMQATFQHFVDASISSTVNLPESATVEDVEQVYKAAWKHGLKGVTVFREGGRRAGILTTDKASKPKLQPAPEPRPLDKVLAGTTTNIKIPCGELNITCNFDELGPCQLIVTPGKTGGCRAQSTAIANLITLALRSGISADRIVEQIKGIRCPSSWRKKDIEAISCPDAIGTALACAFCGDHEQQATHEAEAACSGTERLTDGERENGDVCPVCHTPFAHEGGCVVCKNCGYSKCG